MTGVMSAAKLIVGRVSQALLLLLLVSVGTFALLRLTPGEPGTLLYGQSVTAADLAQVRERWGLDAPIHIQFVQWLSNVATGDLGRSYVDGRPVLVVIWERVPATIALTGSALVLASTVGIAVGYLSARSHSALLRKPLDLMATALYSTPPFWLGIVLVMLLSIRLGWLPPGGLQDPARDPTVGGLLSHLALPVLTLAARDAARFARVTRASVLAVAAEGYVVTATAKGLKDRTIALHHLLRNALLPVLALFGVAIPGLLSGAVVVETVFAWPGMGRLAIESALQRNYSVIMGEVLVVAALAVAGSFLADLACAVADPRVRRRHGR